MTDTTPRGRPFYGIDAPPIPALLGAAGIASAVAATSRRTGRTALAVAGAVLLAGTGIYLHTTLRGKLRAWDAILDRAASTATSRCWTWAAGAARSSSRRRVGSRKDEPWVWTCGRRTRAATAPKPPSPTRRPRGSPIGSKYAAAT